MESVLPHAVCALLREHVHSVEQLSVLLMLHRDRGRSWSLGELAQALGEPRLVVAEALSELVAHELVDVRNHGSELLWHYRPGSRRLDEHVGLLSRAAQERRMDVIRVMLTSSLDRIRSAVALASLDQIVGATSSVDPSRKPPK